MVGCCGRGVDTQFGEGAGSSLGGKLGPPIGCHGPRNPVTSDPPIDKRLQDSIGCGVWDWDRLWATSGQVEHREDVS